MPIKRFVILACLLLFAAGNVLAAGYQNVTPATAYWLMSERPDLQVIDVRSAQEFSQARLENAILLSIHQPEPVYLKQLKALPRDKPYLLYCTVGTRSKKVAEDMERLGFTQVYNLTKGIMEWYNQRYKIIQGAPR